MYFLTLTSVALTAVSAAGASAIVSPRSTSTSSSGRSDEFSGEATFYVQAGQVGACGTVHSDSDLIAALQPARYGNPGTVSPNCGRKIQVTNTQNGRSVTATVADVCPTCARENDLDLSIGAFNTIATEADGEISIVWSFLD